MSKKTYEQRQRARDAAALRSSSNTPLKMDDFPGHCYSTISSLWTAYVLNVEEKIPYKEELTPAQEEQIEIWRGNKKGFFACISSYQAMPGSLDGNTWQDRHEAVILGKKSLPLATGRSSFGGTPGSRKNPTPKPQKPYVPIEEHPGEPHLVAPFHYPQSRGVEFEDETESAVGAYSTNRLKTTTSAAHKKYGTHTVSGVKTTRPPHQSGKPRG
jgi:hypothetical protein